MSVADRIAPLAAMVGLVRAPASLLAAACALAALCLPGVAYSNVVTVVPRAWLSLPLSHSVVTPVPHTCPCVHNNRERRLHRGSHGGGLCCGSGSAAAEC